MTSLAEMLYYWMVGGNAPQDIELTNDATTLAYWFAGNGGAIPAEITAAGGAPISDGIGIETWTELSANAYNPTQGTASARPTWHQNGFGSNNRAYVEFDGGDYLQDVIASGIIGRSNLPAFTQYAVISLVSASTQLHYYSEGNSAGIVPFVALRANRNTGGDVEASIRSDDSTTQTVTSGDQAIDDGNLHLLTLERTGTTTRYYLDGGGSPIATNVLDFTGKAFNTTLVTLGALGRNTVSNHYIGNLALVYTRNATRDTDIETTIKTYYGIS